MVPTVTSNSIKMVLNGRRQILIFKLFKSALKLLELDSAYLKFFLKISNKVQVFRFSSVKETRKNYIIKKLQEALKNFNPFSRFYSGMKNGWTWKRNNYQVLRYIQIHICYAPCRKLTHWPACLTNGLLLHMEHNIYIIILTYYKSCEIKKSLIFIIENCT